MSVKGRVFSDSSFSCERDLDQFGARRQQKQGVASTDFLPGAPPSEGARGDKSKHRHGVPRGNVAKGETSCSPGKSDYNAETADALKKVAEAIERSHSKEAAETFESFQEELAETSATESSIACSVVWCNQRIAYHHPYARCGHKDRQTMGRCMRDEALMPG